MKRAPRSRQRHDLYAKYHDYDSEISDLLGDCGFKKIVAGVGGVTSGVLLAYVAFPQGAKPGEVDPELLRNLALIYLPTIGGFYAVAISCLFLYRIDKSVHEANLRALQEGAIEARTTDAQTEAATPAAAGPAGDLAPVTPRP